MYAIIVLALALVVLVVEGRLLTFDESDDAERNSLEEHLEEEIGENLSHILLVNMRQIRIVNLQLLSEKQKEVTRNFHQDLINNKFSYLEDAETIKELETKLLWRGVWPICGWVEPLPPPYTNDEQCSIAELQYLVDNSEDLE